MAPSPPLPNAEVDAKVKNEIARFMPLWIEAAEEKKERYPCDFDVIWPWFAVHKEGSCKDSTAKHVAPR